MRLLSEVSIDSSEGEIIKFCEGIPMMALDVQVRQMYMDYGTTLLTLKQQQKLLIEQNIYNNKQLFWSRTLTVATWALVVATLLLIKYT